MSTKQRAKKRLQRDLIEWKHLCHEIPTIRALPLENDIFEWHCNIRAQSGPLKGIYIHIVIKFPNDYPNNPPSMKVCHYFNHPNVFRSGIFGSTHDRDGYWICLDMIKSYTKSTPYQGWTMAYSAYSIFFQLQSFMIGQKVPQGGYRNKVHYINTNWYFESYKDKIRQVSENFYCSKCKHSHKEPWPVVPMLDEKVPNLTNKQLKKQRKYAKRDRKNMKKGLNYFEMLYGDVERHIQSFLGLRELFTVSKINVRWSNMIKKLNILQINKFGCWYQRIDLYTAETNNIKLILGYGIIPKIYNNKGPHGFNLISECQTTFDLISHTAYTNCNVRTTVWKDMTFKKWIPMYITKKHGDSIWKYLDQTVLQIWGKNDDNKERKIIHLIASIMNQLIVNIMNNSEKKKVDLKESINVLEAYFHYHHLLLAVYNKYNVILKPYIQGMCYDFINDEDKRDKKNVPNLGELMIYFTLTKFSWNEICLSLLTEGFVRNVKWILMSNPELIFFENNNKYNCYRLTKTYDATIVSKKLYMFQCFFMRKCLDLGNVRWQQKLKEYNNNFGSPPEKLPILLQNKCKSIHYIKTWDEFFKELELPDINMDILTQWLKHSFIVSDKRGYHRNTTWNQIKYKGDTIANGCKFIQEQRKPILKDRKECLCSKGFKHCKYKNSTNINNNCYKNYNVKANMLKWWYPSANDVQCFDNKTYRWYNAKITEFTGGFRCKINYKGWDALYDDTVSIFENRIVKPNTYKIDDDRKGYVNKDDIPNDVNLKKIKDEYERKTRLVKVVERKVNTKKANDLNKSFFEFAGINAELNMKKLLNLPVTVYEFIKYKNIIKNNKKNKKLSTNNDNFNKVKEWKSPFNVNMTDVNNRTPLFICCYKGYFNMIKLLVSVGVDVNVVDVYGETIIDATKSGRENAKIWQRNDFDQISKYLDKMCDKNIIELRKKQIEKENKTFTIKNEAKNNDNDNKDYKKNNIKIVRPMSNKNNNNGVVYKTRTVFIGNIIGVTQEEINSLLNIYNLNYNTCLIKNNFAILRFKRSYKELKTKIDKINGSLFRGATVSASIFENNIKKNDDTGENKPKPNRVLFVKNFDIKRDTYNKLIKIFKKFGNIRNNSIKMNTDKFGEPYCIIEYIDINSAIKLYKYNYVNDVPLNVGDDNVLDIQYSRIIMNNNNDNRKEGELRNGSKPRGRENYNNKGRNRGHGRGKGRGKGRGRGRGRGHRRANGNSKWVYSEGNKNGKKNGIKKGVIRVVLKS